MLRAPLGRRGRGRWSASYARQAIAELTRRLAACLRLAVEAGELAAGADCDQLSAFLRIGWEGAVP
jgi:Tetracyclin repressor-like, C-terminal domain